MRNHIKNAVIRMDLRLINCEVIFLVLLYTSNFSISQNKNNFLFDMSTVFLTPKTGPLDLKHEKLFFEDISYDLKTTFQVGIGFKLACGYEVSLKTIRHLRIGMPILLSYKRIEQRYKQFGTYFAQYYFYGHRETAIAMNVMSLSLGLNFANRDYKGREWELAVNISGSKNVNTNFRIKESPENCIVCYSNDEKYVITDLGLYYSFDFKVARLYPFRKILLGPFAAYNFNNYYDPRIKTIGFTNKFDNTTYNLRYYHFIETGLKIKI